MAQEVPRGPYAMGRVSIGDSGQPWRLAFCSARCSWSSWCGSSVGWSIAAYGRAGGWCLGPCRETTSVALRQLAGSPARKLVLLLPNKVVTAGMTDLASVYRAGAVDRAVDD
jgi:hypothetical protein